MGREETDDIERRCIGYLARGFYPVRWAHHPREIKDAIRRIGFRPLMKQCYRNSQLLAISNEVLGLGLDLEYREGWGLSLTPIEHAWLFYKGEILDLTIDDNDIQYGRSYSYTPEQIRTNIIRNLSYSPLTDGRRFSEIHPHREAWARLNGGSEG
jgi:hypothetical protein